MLKATITDTEPLSTSSPSPQDAHPNRADDLVTAERIRDTARAIGDRVRRVLVPADSPIATLRFLVVDDEPDSADSLAAVLEMLGWSVRACYDGASAILTAAEFDPQVCLLDLKMPRMDGFQLAGHLKAHSSGRKLLLIAATALGDPDSRRRSLEAGFHSHLVKPINFPMLIDAVARLWETILEEPPMR
jgi:CheY-like chemotaxis protein